MQNLEAGNVFSLKAFGTILDFKFDCLAFVERFIDIPANESEGQTRATKS